jgi:hypothetical protein
MANHFPTLPDGTHVATIIYSVTMTPVSDIAGRQNVGGFADAQIMSVGFDTGIDESGNITYDYSWFDQDTYEANLTTWLNSLCTLAVSNLGVTTTAAQAAIEIHRQWIFEIDATLSSSYAPVVLSSTTTDQMIYPS